MKQDRTLICPTDDYECPYYKRGFCRMLSMTGDNPILECEAWDIDDEEDDE